MLATMFLNLNNTANALQGSVGRLCKIQSRATQLALGLVLMLLLSTVNTAQAQTINVSSAPPVVCLGNAVTIIYSVPIGLPSGVTVKFYTVHFQDPAAGGADSSRNNGPGAGNATNPSYPAGVYSPFVSAELTDGTIITSAPITVTVYNLPIADFSVITLDTQCFLGNSVCFKNLALQGSAPSNPLSTFLWEFGDNVATTTTTTADVCHSYLFDRSFFVSLFVTDDKGCQKDTVLQPFQPIVIKPALSPKMKWRNRTGPCFISNYLFTNLTPVSIDSLFSFRYEFGDTGAGNFYYAEAPFDATERAFYDTIGHDYVMDGEFSPLLVVTDKSNARCTDSIRYDASSGTLLPRNIRFTFDVVTTRTATSSEARDSVCVGSRNSASICFKQTPITQASAGTGDFVWNFDDPPSMQLNFNINSWQPCHTFTSMKTFYVTLTISNVCPTPIRHTYISAATFFDDKYIDKYIYDNNDALDPVSRPRLMFDTIIRPKLKEPLRKLTRLEGSFLSGDTIIGNDTFYVYRGKTERPLYYISNDTLLFKAPNVLRDTIDLPTNWETIYAVPGTNPVDFDTIAGYKYYGYGARVIGPFARIEKTTPPPVVIKATMKNQCGPTDTIDFVNTSLSYKSRMNWRIWDFDDDFAPQCTAFSVPMEFYPPIAAIKPLDSVSYDNGQTFVKFGPDTIRKWVDAQQQYLNSYHYFIVDGITYQGRMNCKFSFDTLPRHHYPDWDTVYRWHLTGKDFMPWNPAQYSITPTPGRITVNPADTFFWGKPVYLNPHTGQWSLFQGTGPAPFGLWDRIDDIEFKYNNDRDLRVGEPITVRNLPDPFRSANPDGGYNIVAGATVTPINTISYRHTNGVLYSIKGSDTLPGGPPYMSFYKYAFLRTISRCMNVTLNLRDSFNNETLGGTTDDSTKLDSLDCRMEATVQLPLARADARGLGKRGNECPGRSPNGVFFELGAEGRYPGVVPGCGQTFILFNFDSLADRLDATPCVLDGFLSYVGGTTPGGRSLPPFFTTPDFMPIPWTSPSPTTIAFHYGLNAPGGVPPPADTAQGWITVGLAIGSGCKDTVVPNVPISQYRSNIAYYGDANNVGSIIANINVPVGYNAGNTPVPGLSPTYDFSFTQINNFRLVPVGMFIDTIIDIVYNDCAWPKCVSDTVWYHRFLRTNNLSARFDVDPINCKLRHKGEDVIVHYQDSVQDEIKFSVWQWGDGTLTVDSFYYAPDSLPGLTNGYYINGVRRVRYEWDILNNPILLDSTVWPIRASGIGATDGLQPLTLTTTINAPNFYRLFNILDRTAIVDSIIIQDKCSMIIDTIANKDTIQFFPFSQFIDTALMFLPITHRFVRSSWEVARKQPGASTGNIFHFLQSRKGCTQNFARPVTIGFIDTFDIVNSDKVIDTLYCENDEVFFIDSLRYFRYDCNVTDLPFVPAVTNSLAHFGVLAPDPITGFAYDALQIDSADFWRQDVGDPRPIQNIVTHPPYLGRSVKDTIVPERVYWDFGDGSPIDSSVRPSHRYASYGRYTVTMVSRDSLGYFDTCVGFVNITKPLARIAFTNPSRTFNCGDIANFIDSSEMRSGGGSDSLSQGIDKVLTNYWWFGQNLLDTVLWDTKLNFTPTVIYRRNGLFRLRLVSESQLGCRDTTYDTVFVKGPRPNFLLLNPGDTIGCAPFRVRVVNNADSLGKQIDINGNPITDTVTKTTVLFWGNKSGSQVSMFGRRDTVEFTYDSAGVYSIYVFGSDAAFGGANDCPQVRYPDTLYQQEIKITVLKLPTKITVDKDIICKDESVTFTNQSDTNFLSYSYIIQKDTMRVDSIYINVVPPHTFNRQFVETGLFQIIAQPENISSLIAESAKNNCRIKDTLTVNVVAPAASFTVDSSSIKPPEFKMVNTSDTSLNSQYEWLVRKVGNPAPLFGTPLTATNTIPSGLVHPNFNLVFNVGEDTGSYEVCLTSFATGLPIDLGCKDSVCETVRYTFVTDVEVPNVFSPNNDATNDNFEIRILGQEKYNFEVFNRWGAKVFESTDATKLWNGKTFNEGAECPAGVYYYIFDYKLKAKDPVTKTGTITLIR